MKSIIITLAAVLMTTSAWATSYKWNMGLGLGTAYTMNTDIAEDVLDQQDLAGALWLAYNFTDNWSVVLDYDHLTFGENLSAETTYENINLGVNYRCNNWGSFSPYIGVGLGAGRLKDFPTTTDDSLSKMAPRVRLGFDYKMKSNLALGLIVDYHFFQPDSDTMASDRQGNTGKFNEAHFIAPMLGLSYSFGARGPAMAADSDNDGVNDDMDKCAGTPAGTMVNSKGCKKAMMDADGDGIADADDRCSSTPAGTAVNAYGCAAKETFEMKLNVQFDSGKSVVKDQYAAQLTKVAAFMKANTSASAEIAGYTDSMGKESYNVWLSQKRADAVRAYLVNKLGVDAKRLTAKGYGPANPIASNKTREGRATNRRVIATFKGK